MSARHLELGGNICIDLEVAFKTSLEIIGALRKYKLMCLDAAILQVNSDIAVLVRVEVPEAVSPKFNA